jgi:hypothetical protein
MSVVSRTTNWLSRAKAKPGTCLLVAEPYFTRLRLGFILDTIGGASLSRSVGRNATMTFKKKSQVLEVSTRARLCELVDASLTKRERFTLEKEQGHSLSVVAYDNEALLLELHRGKKWEGWVSGPTKADDARTTLHDYYDEPLSTPEGIEKRGEWMEVAAFHPAVYIVAAILMTALIVWATWFRR